MAEEIIIKVKADTGEVEPSIEAIKRLGKAAEEDVKSFVKLDDAIKKGVNQGIKDAAVQMLKFQQESGKATKETVDGFNTIKQKIKEVTIEAQRAGEQYGENSKEAVAAQSELAQLVKQQDDFNKRIEALNPNKVAAFSQLTRAAVGGVQTLTGSLQLLGVENEAVREVAQKLQAALNLSQGIASIVDIGDSLKNLRVVLGVTTAAQTSLAVATEAEAVAATKATAANTALLATLAPVVLAIGALVGVLYLVAEATEDNSEAISKQNEEYKKQLELQNLIADGYLDVLDAQKKQQAFEIQTAELQGKSELEILQIKQDQNRENQHTLRIAREAATDSKTYKAINDDILEVTREIELTQLRIVKAIKDRTKAAQDEAFKAREEVDGIARRNTPLVLNPEVEAINARDTMDVIADVIEQKSSDLKPVNLKVQVTPEDLQAAQDAISTVADFTSAFFDLQRSLSEKESDARINDLERQKKAGLISEEQYQMGVKKIRTEQAQQAKAQATFEAGLGVAIAIINALRTPPAPNVAAAGIAAALGAIQVAAIASRPLPKYKKGTEWIPGINKGDDSVMAMLQPGEAVIPRSTNINYQPAVSAIYNKKIPAKVMNNFVKDYVSGRVGTTNVNAKVNPYDMRYAMDGLGMKIKNTKQLASDIAAIMPTTSNVSERRLWH